MNLYVIYDTASGRIMKYGRATETGDDGGASMAAQAGSEQSWIAVATLPDALASYVLGGFVTMRPACPVTLAIASRNVTLTGVPSGAAYSVSGDASLAGVADASGELDFTFGAAGTYQIAVACFPAIDFVQGVTLP